MNQSHRKERERSNEKKHKNKSSHKEGTKKTGSISIEPVYNRLAVFKSELLHEVVPCHKTRYSVTTWLKDQLNEVTFLAI